MASKLLGAGSGALSGAAAGSSLGAPGAIAGGALGLLGGLFGGGDNDEAIAAMERAAAAINAIGLPPDLSNPVTIKYLQQSGIMKPEMLEKLSLNADKVNTLIENPDNIKQQKYALNALKDMSATGLTATDRAAYNQLRSQVAGDTQAKTNQILQQQQMRGQASSGDSLAAQLAAIQGSNQNASKEADRIAADATSARRNALSQFSGLASGMRDQDLGTQKYNMQNEIERQKFLDANSLSRQAANVQNANAAQQMNLQRQQQVGDTNVNMGNSELYRQQQAKRDYWNDKLRQASAAAGVYQNEASMLGQQAANSAASNQSMITAGLGALGTLGNKFGSTPKYDTNVSKAVNPQGVAADQINALDNFTMKPKYASGGVVPSPSPVFQKNAEEFTKGFNKGGSIEESVNNLKNALFGKEPNKNMAHGGVVGEVPTDTEQDDRVPAMLSPGEIVIPKSFAHDPDLSKAYINFIHKHKNPKSKK